MKCYPWIQLLLLLALALLLRLPGQWWGYYGDSHNHYHPDEDRLLRSALEVHNGQRPSDYYPFGYSVQVGALARLLRIEAKSMWDLLPVARAVSLFYGVITVGLLFAAAAPLGVPAAWRWLPALCYAVAGLPVVYSHYATADTTLTFYFLATLVTALLAYQRRSLAWALASAALCGVALAVKLPLVLLPVVAVASLRCRRPWLSFPLSVAVIVLIAEALCLFFYDLQRFHNLIYMVRTDNVGVIPKHEYSGNIVVLLLEVIVSLGLISSFLIARGGAVVTRRCCTTEVRRFLSYVICFVLPAVVWLISICMMPIPFARHLLPILPLLCLLAPFGVIQIKNKWPRPLSIFIVVLMAVYQFAYWISVEGQYVIDSRQQMDRWLTSNRSNEAPLYYCWYSELHAWNAAFVRTRIFDDARFVLMHEAFYRRYIRSAVNPFRSYPRDERIFHPKGMTHNIQRVLKEDGYRLVKRFPVHYWTPELILFKQLYGAFPDFTGDSVLYEKVMSSTGDET
jgi:MFS family permease